MEEEKWFGDSVLLLTENKTLNKIKKNSRETWTWNENKRMVSETNRITGNKNQKKNDIELWISEILYYWLNEMSKRKATRIALAINAFTVDRLTKLKENID